MIKDISLREGFWPILALDHGLTDHTDAVSISMVPRLLKDCRENIGSVVMTYGLARLIQGSINQLPVIIQCFGSPLSHPKVQVCDIEQAQSLNASGIAVQVDFSLDKDTFTSQISSISRIVYQAHKENLPTLFMVSSSGMKSFKDFCQSVRFCQELGADLVKISFNKSSFEEDIDLNMCRAFLKDAPPVLLAGGVVHDGILDAVETAKGMGFSGYCIGRNIYQAANPSEISRKLHQAWCRKK